MVESPPILTDEERKRVAKILEESEQIEAEKEREDVLKVWFPSFFLGAEPNDYFFQLLRPKHGSGKC